MPDVFVELVDADGAPVPAQLAFVPSHSRTSSGTVQTGPSGKLGLSIERVDNLEMLVMPKRAGFWSSHHTLRAGLNRVVCAPIKTTEAWWARCTGLANVTKRGEGVVIGIVDTSFESQAGIDHVEIHGVGRAPRRRDDDGSIWRHGEAIARILGDRSPVLGGMAQGARIVCYTADCVPPVAAQALAEPHNGLVFDHDQLELDPAEVASGIMSLAKQHKADVINLSAGAFADPSQFSGLSDVIEAAFDIGTVCIVAAGNTECDELAFPAYVDRCISVGAIGCCKWGPPGSIAELERMRSVATGGRSGELDGYGPVFHWVDSAYGPGLEAVAPGVGIVISRDGRPAFDVVGTSFAAPVATGALAVALSMDHDYLGLPRTSERSERAVGVFRSLCKQTTISPRFVGRGVPFLREGTNIDF